MIITKDAYYFPHFCNARHDRKILRLRKELGIEGYGIFFMLLEVLRDQIDFKYPIKDLDLLAEEFGTSETKIRVVICNYQLFTIDEAEQFFSPKLMIYLQPYLTMKAQRSIAGTASANARKQRLLEQPTNDRSTDVEHSFNEIQQSKVKESKVNNNIGEIDSFFETLWSLYPNKKGKGQVSKKQKERLHTVGLEHMKRCIERFEMDMKGRDKQYFPYGSTFFNSGYVDYLDDNWNKPDAPKSKYKDMTGYEPG